MRCKIHEVIQQELSSDKSKYYGEDNNNQIDDNKDSDSIIISKFNTYSDGTLLQFFLVNYLEFQILTSR